MSIEKSKKGDEDESEEAMSSSLDQVMLLLESVDDGEMGAVSAVFVGTEMDGSESASDPMKYSYQIQANPKRLVKLLKGREGEYVMTVVIGDRSISNSISWNIGNVAIEMDITGSKEERKKDMDTQRSMTTMKPEINHIFNESEKRASDAVAYIFVAIIFIALPLLVIMLAFTSSNSLFNAFPRTLGGITASLFFHASSLAMFYVLVQFFKHQYIAEILPAMAGVGLITSVAGYTLLSHLATTRLEAKLKKKENHSKRE